MSYLPVARTMIGCIGPHTSLGSLNMSLNQAGFLRNCVVAPNIEMMCSVGSGAVFAVYSAAMKTEH